MILDRLAKPKCSEANTKYMQSNMINNIRFRTDGSAYKAVCYYTLGQVDFEQLNDLVERLTRIKEDITLFIHNNLLCINIDFTGSDVVELENRFYDTIKQYCNRSSEDEIFIDAFTTSFPTYEIPKTIVKGNIDDISQTVGDGFGYFVLSNDAVNNFGLVAKPMLGTAISINKFANIISADGMHTIFDNLDDCIIVDMIQCLPEDDTRQMLKQRRAEYRFNAMMSEEQTDVYAASNEQRKANLATQAINELDNNEIMCSFSRYIFVYAETKEDLRKKADSIIEYLHDRDIYARRALSQAPLYMNICINKVVFTNVMQNFASIKFPISLRYQPKEIIQAEDEHKTEANVDKRKTIETYICSFCGTMYKGTFTGFMPPCPCCGSRDFKLEKS